MAASGALYGAFAVPLGSAGVVIVNGGGSRSTAALADFVGSAALVAVTVTV